MLQLLIPCFPLKGDEMDTEGRDKVFHSRGRREGNRGVLKGGVVVRGSVGLSRQLRRGCEWAAEEAE